MFHVRRHNWDMNDGQRWGWKTNQQQIRQISSRKTWPLTQGWSKVMDHPNWTWPLHKSWSWEASKWTAPLWWHCYIVASTRAGGCPHESLDKREAHRGALSKGEMIYQCPLGRPGPFVDLNWTTNSSFRISSHQCFVPIDMMWINYVLVEFLIVKGRNVQADLTSNVLLKLSGPEIHAILSHTIALWADLALIAFSSDFIHNYPASLTRKPGTNVQLDMVFTHQAWTLYFWLWI